MGQETGKLIIYIAIIKLMLGIAIYFFGNKLGWIGNLPGDIKYDNGRIKVYFPLATMIIFSLLLNLALYIFRRL